MRARESERERERRKEDTKGFGRKGRDGSEEAAIEAEYKVVLFRYCGRGRTRERRRGEEKSNSTPDGEKSVRNWITTTE